MLNKNFFVRKPGGGGSLLPKDIIAPSGRHLYRHSSNMGTVMEFNDGQPRSVLVLDAKYRSNQTMGLYNVDIDLPKNNIGFVFLNPSSGISGNTTIGAATISDEWINTNVLVDENTSRYNCDMWMKYSDVTDENGVVGSPAVSYCRSIFVDGASCDLPNIQTLARIYCDAEALDSMDPTIPKNSIYALGSRNPQGNWYIGTGSNNMSAFSSTYGNVATKAVCVMYIANVSELNRDNTVVPSIIPVLEL